MNRKSKGINAERELVKMFWENGWAALRTPASGAMRFPSPDIIASNKIRTLAIECKASREPRKYFRIKDLEGLSRFSSIFGAEQWVGVRFDKQEWMFISPRDLLKTPRGLSITLNRAKMRGVLLEELIV